MSDETAILPKYDFTTVGSFTMSPAEYSDWECQLFGGSGIVWRPLKDQCPNWFWRQMQFLVFGNRWVWKPQK